MSALGLNQDWAGPGAASGAAPQGNSTDQQQLPPVSAPTGTGNPVADLELSASGRGAGVMSPSPGGFAAPKPNAAMNLQAELAASGRGAGISFADGGAIDDSDPGDGSTDPSQDPISKALASVDAVLQFGRARHGLGGGNQEDDGAIKGTQEAAAMPMIPGSQSESGIPPQRPQPPGGQVADASYTNGRMPARPGSQSDSGVQPIQPAPGPLPPTSNPFGKRADAGDDDEQDGAIDTETA